MLITNVVLPSSGSGERSWIKIGGARISQTGSMNDAVPQDAEIYDAAGAMALPGLIDTHVHFREPGFEDKGNIATESRAAYAGGITSFIDMPNTRPATLTAETFADKLRRAAASSAVNYGFFLGASEATPEVLAKLDRRKVPGIKLFLGATTGAVATPSAQALDRLFRVCAEIGLPIVVHAEDDAVIAANAQAAILRYGSREAVPVSEHRNIRSRQACLQATARAVELAHRFGTRLHIAHVSTADEVRLFLSAGPVKSKLITAETTPMYMDPELCSRNDWRTKINPSIKGCDDAEAIRDAVRNGLIDTVATDHAPHLVAHKQGGALTAASGAPSVQFALPVMLEYLDAPCIARVMSANPAAIFGIEGRGSLCAGSKADITLVRTLDQPHVITDSDVITPAAWTPFAGRAVNHSVEKVWLNGTTAIPEPLTFT